MKTSNFKASIALAVCVIAVLMMPLATHDGYIIQLLNIAMLNAIVVLGLNFATGWTGPLDEVLRSTVAALSPNGILGDPTGSSADEGWLLLDALADDLLASYDRWRA